MKAVFEKLVEIICNKMAESLDKVRKGERERGGAGGEKSMVFISARSKPGNKRNEIGCEYDSEASISTVQLLIALIPPPPPCIYFHSSIYCHLVICDDVFFSRHNNSLSFSGQILLLITTRELPFFFYSSNKLA